MIEQPVKPGFLIRRLLLLSGARAAPDVADPEVARFSLHESSAIEAVWTGLEPLIYALNLAGYECPEMFVATPWRGDMFRGMGFVLLDAGDGAATYAPYDWRPITGLDVGPDVYSVFLLRIRVRRTYGVTPIHEPIPLESDPSIAYAKRPDSGDKLFDPLDGYIALTSSESKLPHEVAAKVAVPVAERVVGLLVSEWNQSSTRGLVHCLNPAVWELPADRDAPAHEFVTLAAQIWGVLAKPDGMRQFLEAPLFDGDAALERLMPKVEGVVAVPAALEALRRRAWYFHADHANLELLLELNTMLRLHWGLAVLLLHEFGLIRILPFPLTFEVGIEFLDLTGRYESVAVPFEPGMTAPLIATMQLHHAGEFLEGWWYDDQLRRWDVSSWKAPHSKGAGKLAFEAVFRREGVIADVEIENIPDTDEYWADLTFDVTFNGVTYPMKRVRRRAQVPPDLRLALIGAPPELEAQSVELHWLSQKGLERAAFGFYTHLERISRLGEAEWPAEMDVAEAALRRTLADNSVFVYNVGQIVETPMLSRLRRVFREELRVYRIESAGLDAWTQLRNILTILDGSGNATSTLLRALLSIAADDGHTYTFQWGGVGGAAGGDVIVLQGEAGSFAFGGHIEHHQECGSTDSASHPHGWVYWYYGQLSELSGGVGFGIGVGVALVMHSSPNDIVTTEEWAPDDFGPDKIANPQALPVCWFGIASRGSSDTAAYYVQGEVGWDDAEGYIFFSRNRMAVATGTGDGWNWKAGVGMGGGTNYYGEGTIGVIMGRGNGDQPVVPPPAPVSLEWSRSERVTFRTDKYKLTPYGREVLARYVARHRAFFESPTAYAVIEGDATPLGDGPYNETLSWKRALHVYSTIRTLLAAPASGRFGVSHGLVIGEDRLRLLANGEVEAHVHGVPEDSDPEDWRRTKVLLDSKVLLAL